MSEHISGRDRKERFAGTDIASDVVVDSGLLREGRDGTGSSGAAGSMPARSTSSEVVEPPYYNVLVEFPDGAKRIDRHHATIEWLKSELYYQNRHSGNRYTILTDAQYDALVAEWALARRDAERDARRAA